MDSVPREDELPVAMPDRVRARMGGSRGSVFWLLVVVEAGAAAAGVWLSGWQAWLDLAGVYGLLYLYVAMLRRGLV